MSDGKRSPKAKTNLTSPADGEAIEENGQQFKFDNPEVSPKGSLPDRFNFNSNSGMVGDEPPVNDHDNIPE